MVSFVIITPQMTTLTQKAKNTQIWNLSQKFVLADPSYPATFFDGPTIVEYKTILFFCTFLHVSVLYSFEIVKFYHKTCRQKTEKYKFE